MRTVTPPRLGMDNTVAVLVEKTRRIVAISDDVDAFELIRAISWTLDNYTCND
jgi:hypothetical protein